LNENKGDFSIMIDINLIRKKTDEVRDALLKRMDHLDFSELLKWGKERRKLISEVDKLREKRNKVSSQIPLMKKEGKDVTKYVQEMKTVSNKIKNLNIQLSERKKKRKSFLERLPNIPDDDVRGGGKENNEIICTWKKKPEFDFQPKNHIDLVKSLVAVYYQPWSSSFNKKMEVC